MLCFESLGSTQDFLKAHPDLPFWTAVLAKEQRAGRGRHGRSFYAPKDCGLYLSVKLPKQVAPVVTPMAALALLRTLAPYRAGIRIKWVNDLLVDDKKLAGILAEQSAEAIFLGVGVNLFPSLEGFPEGLRRPATCLLEAQVPGLIEALAEDFLSLLPPLLAQPDFEGYRAKLWKERGLALWHRGNEASPIEVLGLDASFGLSVRDEGGRCFVLSDGEIKWIEGDKQIKNWETVFED